MADIKLKTLKLPNSENTYTVPQNANDVGALPISGGTLTGNLTFSGYNPLITITSANKFLRLAGSDNGASLLLSNNNRSNFEGSFQLIAADGSSTIQLVGRPDGSLTWNSNPIGLQAYPVDSIYMSINSTSPASLFGGTWEQLKDKFLLGAGDTYAAGSVGGEAAHALTEAEGPMHYGHHTPYNSPEASVGEAGEDTYYLDASYSMKKYGTDRPFVCRAGNEVVNRNFSKGSGTAHNNMPPYLTVYMWKRIA